MPFTVTMPKLSPTMEQGTIVKWHAHEGDHVEAGQVLIEVATDKATVEYEALDEGYLRKILVPEGKAGKVNQAIAVFTAEKDESIDGYKAEEESEKEEEVEETEESVESEARAPKKEAVAYASGLQQPAFTPEAPLEDYRFEQPRGDLSERLKASPLARRIAKERGLDLSTVKGSGPGDRIMSRDLDLAQANAAASFSHREVPTKKPGSYTEEPVTPIRQVIAQRLQEAKTFIPHFYAEQTIDVDSLVEIREQLKQNGIRVSVNDFVVRACALALREHPNINSGYNNENGTIVQYETIDISVAVTLPEGLITPIIRHADYKNIGEISVEVKHLAKRAKEHSLQPHEYKGGSFTVSNLGMFGVTSFTAIINPPQGAILAVSGIKEVPVVKQGKVVPGKIMNVVLSSDHRVIDGVAAAQFLQTVQKYLESPAVLII